MTIREHWIDMLYRAATATRRTRTLLTPVGLLVFGAFVVVFVVASAWVDRTLALPWPLPELPTNIASAVMLSAGAVLTCWSVVHFLKVKGTPVPLNPPPSLVVTGPYSRIRNPMLTGVFVMLFGLGFVMRSLSLVVFFTPMFILANVWELKNIEEPELSRRLGDEYRDYREKTPMFIPHVKSEG